MANPLGWARLAKIKKPTTLSRRLTVAGQGEFCQFYGLTQLPPA